MVKESPVSVILIVLVIVIAVVGPMAKQDGGGLMKSEVYSDFGAIPVVVLAILVALGYIVWKRGQPWKRR